MPDIFDASAQRNVHPSVEPDAFPSDDSDIVEAEMPLMTSDTTLATPPTPSRSLEISTDAAFASTDSLSDQTPTVKLTRSVNDYSETMSHERASNNPLKAFLAKPTRIHFDSQHPDEKVLLLLRRHPITQLGWIIIATIGVFVPLLFLRVGVFNFLPPNFQFAAMLGWYLLLLTYVLESFVSWFYNVYIITDERVIDVDFINLIYKNIAAAKIENIEDITAVTGGVLASIFNYGTVTLQTAGASAQIEFEDVPQPAKVTAFLNELLLEEERERNENRTN